MKTIQNAIRLMREFSDTAPTLGVSELSRRLDLDRATVHRMLRTLCDEDMMEQDNDTKLYRLGPGLVQLAQSSLRQHGVGEMAKRHLEALRDKTGETVGLAVPQGRELVCIATAAAKHPLRIAYYIGERTPLHCTSSGLLYLAHVSTAARNAALKGKLTKYTPRTVTDRRKVEAMIDDARREGISFTDGSYIEGTRSISAPVVGSAGDLYAVATIVAPSQRMLTKKIPTLAQALKATADRIATEIDRLGTIRGLSQAGVDPIRPDTPRVAIGR